MHLLKMLNGMPRELVGMMSLAMMSLVTILPMVLLVTHPTPANHSHLRCSSLSSTQAPILYRYFMT